MIRQLEYSDYYKSYMNLINTFTRSIEEISYNKFCKSIDSIYNQNAYIYVIEEDNNIIGTIKIMIEYKLHNNLRPVAHIEDVVVHKSYRNRGLGKLLIDHAKEISNNHNCYKIVLSCNKENIEFYKRSGFIEKGSEMTIYI